MPSIFREREHAAWGRWIRAYLRGDLEGVARWAPSLGPLLVTIGLIGLARHALEIAGGNPGSVRWAPASVANTVLYAYFVACVPLTLVLWWHRASAQHIALGFRVAVPLTAVIHLLAPLGNAAFNYHGPRWPEHFVWAWLPTHLYFPVGTALGFAYALIVGASWVRRILGVSRVRSLATTLAAGALILFYCYQFAVALAFGPEWRLLSPALLKPGWVGIDQQIQFYSVWLSWPVAAALWWLLRPALTAQWPRVLWVRSAGVCCWVVFLAASFSFIYL